MTIDEIRKALKERRISAAAEATGLHQNTIAKIRDGETCDPSSVTLRKLISYLSDNTSKTNTALEVLGKLEDAACYAWNIKKDMPNNFVGDCSINLFPDGISVSCRITNRDVDPDRLAAAGYRMISYHAVEAAKTNILIDAINVVFDEVCESASKG